MLGVKPLETWHSAAFKCFPKSGHKASLSDDVSRGPWLDQHQSGEMIQRIGQGLLDAVTNAKRTRSVSPAMTGVRFRGRAVGVVGNGQSLHFSSEYLAGFGKIKPGCIRPVATNRLRPETKKG